ncbi:MULTISPECIES: hypothetical protein [unclassified Microbacterium]|uniref:hypothetical protein n=1 Tax=unclassified Microbacterium TaxID=2609290 RepID=UPI0012F8B78C|nr:hypothetical protein [Microbacterium sp. MAH-37]MVQ42956.1 hypothetical protein [Microbacterium sp. MAH-37]
MNAAELQSEIAFAEREREEAYAAYRRALHALTEADLRLLDARLELEDAIAAGDLARPSDTTGKA